MGRKSHGALWRAVLLTAFIARAGLAGDAVGVPTVTAESGGGAAPLPSGAPSESSLGPWGADTQAEEKKPEALEPLFVRPLAQIESGRNDVSPVWSPQGTFLSLERRTGDKREIRILFPDGTPVQTLYYQLSDRGNEMNFLFPGVPEAASYNTGITWSPGEDGFAFMSNGGEGNYDLYFQDLGSQTARRLTDHKEKDGQAHWSPVANRIVFVSGRTGNGDVYLMDMPTRALMRLTWGGKAHLYPRWSPDGKRIAMMRGSNENHNIILINDVTKPVESLKALTTWGHDDLRPVWSPDGKRIAFYSNYNRLADPKIWSIVVIAADGSDPTEGDGLTARVVATDVIPDVDTGPAWMPDSSRIVFVKNDRLEYNPIYVVDVAQKSAVPIKTDTKMNHDVACSPDGTIAFRAQVDQWDQIFVMKLKN